MEQLDRQWQQYANSAMQFDGKEYKGFDKAKFNACHKLMVEYAVPGIEKIEQKTQILNATYSKESKAIMPFLQKDLKMGGTLMDDMAMTQLISALKESSKSNKKAMALAKKVVDMRIANLQKKDRSKERSFESNGKRITATDIFIQQYERLLTDDNE